MTPQMRDSSPRWKRSRVLDRVYVNGGRTELKLSCGHSCYVSPYGRYARAKTITCVREGCTGRDA